MAKDRKKAAAAARKAAKMQQDQVGTAAEGIEGPSRHSLQTGLKVPGRAELLESKEKMSEKSWKSLQHAFSVAAPVEEGVKLMMLLSTLPNVLPCSTWR